MRLLGQFQASLFIYLFYEKTLSFQKASKSKATNFPFSEVFMREKLLPLFFFVRLFVFLLVGFGWFAFFYAQNLFVK